MKKLFTDSLINFISGLGTSKDKSTASQYAAKNIDFQQLLTAYEFSWIAQKVIDIPVEDAIREWRAWQGSKEQINALETMERSLGLVDKIKSAMVVDRLLGGGALIFKVDGTGDWSEPLDLNRVKKGSLKYVHWVDRTELSCSEMEMDLDSPFFGEPKLYRLQSAATHAEIHPSRAVKFVTRKHPSRAVQTDGWGQSILEAMDSPIKDALGAAAGISTLVQEASVDVVKIQNLMDYVSTEEDKNKLIARMTAVKMSKSITNTTILDAEEDWQRVAVSFSALPDVLQILLNIAAAAGDIPVTRLLGQAPGGLNSTGEGDLRNYYDNVGSRQKNNIQPALARLDEVIIRSTFGARPPEIFYNWRPLWQESDSTKADIFLKRTQGVANIVNTALLDQTALATATQNMLIEDGTLVGLENAVEEIDGDLDESDEEVIEQFEQS